MLGPSYTDCICTGLTRLGWWGGGVDAKQKRIEIVCYSVFCFSCAEYRFMSHSFSQSPCQSLSIVGGHGMLMLRGRFPNQKYPLPGTEYHCQDIHSRHITIARHRVSLPGYSYQAHYIAWHRVSLPRISIPGTLSLPDTKYLFSTQLPVHLRMNANGN
jgi:hypothetical protein